MQPRRHRMRWQARRESSRAWIASGAAASIKAYARYGVDWVCVHDALAVQRRRRGHTTLCSDLA
jgi:hypothetical protein